MHRLNFTLDEEAVQLLERLAKTYYQGNKSQTVRAALESLAVHIGREGWVIAGYTAVEVHDDVACHSCGTSFHEGDVLLRPVFERGSSPSALAHIPSEQWLECTTCAEERFSA